MKPYTQLTRDEMKELHRQLQDEFHAIKGKNLKLDMSRGKPGQEQLNLSMDMRQMLDDHSVFVGEDGVDCRSYGVLDGIKEAKELFAFIMELPPECIIVMGNSSLNIMYDAVSRAMTHGIMGHTPWGKLPKVKFLCPVPGYDRHFAITEYFGIEMINIPMSETGPDMERIEKLVADDPSVKGIWCVPKYSNPQGISYDDETVRRFAALQPAADDFRIFWDNTYTIHHLYEDKKDIILNLYEECKKNGTEDMAYFFASTSKMTFPGAGICAFGASPNNIADVKRSMFFQTIGYDKLNQLRHVRFFKDGAGLTEHMKKHAAIVRPKFDLVLNTLEQELGGLHIGSWFKPKGGYFIGFDAMDGCAKQIVARAKEAGLVMTGAGATYPYGKDPKDSNIRIAPTFPSMDELALAVQIFVLSVKLVSLEKLMES